MTSGITSATSTTNTGTAVGSTVGQAAGLGKDDFMKLLIAQLQNQDPMQPTDDTQFVAQLAQFSSLEAMDSMNSTMEEMAGAQMLGQAASMIGKPITAKLDDGTIVTGTVTAVHMVDSKPLVVVNGQEIDTSLITSVGDTSSGSATTSSTTGTSAGSNTTSTPTKS